MALEEKWNLSLQIIAGYQQGSEGGLKLAILKELRQRGFKSIWRILWENDLSFRCQKILFEYFRAVLNVKIHELARRIGTVVFAPRADSQGNDAAGRCSCNQVKYFEKLQAEPLLNLGQDRRGNNSAYPSAVDRQNFYARHSNNLARS